MVAGKYGSLQLNDDVEQENLNKKVIVVEESVGTSKSGGGGVSGHAYFEALKEESNRDFEAQLDEESSVVLDDIPLPLRLAPLIKRLTDSDDELSDEDILSIIFIIRIADAMHRYVQMSV